MWRSIPQTDTPVISLHTSTDEYRRGVDIRDEGWGRWVKTSMALNPVLSWNPGFP